MYEIKLNSDTVFFIWKHEAAKNIICSIYFIYVTIKFAYFLKVMFSCWGSPFASTLAPVFIHPHNTLLSLCM